MKIKQYHLSVLILLLANFSVIGQTCYDGLLETTPNEQFELVNNELVKDKQTGLIWLRCAWGQSWNESSENCEGNSVAVPWSEGLQLAATVEVQGFNDWRLPNIKELSTLVEKACVEPAINSNFFNNTIAENYWTSTTVVDDPSAAWSITFVTGRNNTKNKQLDLRLRLVRFDEF